MRSKAEIRKEIRALTRTFAEAAAHGPKSAEAWAKAEAMEAFGKAGCILLYCSLPDEVSTQAFIDRWYGKKRLVVPLVVGEDLVLKEYDPLKIRPGYMGIPEPTGEAVTVEPSEVELAFIPGVVFDGEGSRIGRGKGFYDRLLPKLACTKVGICFRFQKVTDRIPCDPWDMKVDNVITD